MNSARICQVCSTSHRREFQGTKCRNCAAILNEQYCRSCNTWKSIDDFNKRQDGRPRSECKICGRERKKLHDKNNRDQRYARDKRFIDKRKDWASTMFNEWLEVVNELPFKPLTEDQWLKACNHFGGCALCGDDHIEVRQFFISFNDGGRYTAWNIYPICGKCATKVKLIPNTFAWLDKYLGYARLLGVTEERAFKLIEYLQLQIGKVVNDNEQKTSSV